MQIDLEPHEHSTLVEMVKIPKRLFYLTALIWVILAFGGSYVLGYGWGGVGLAIFSVFIGVGWAGAFPEYHFRRLKD